MKKKIVFDFIVTQLLALLLCNLQYFILITRVIVICLSPENVVILCVSGATFASDKVIAMYQLKISYPLEMLLHMVCFFKPQSLLFSLSPEPICFSWSFSPSIRITSCCKGKEKLLSLSLSSSSFK